MKNSLRINMERNLFLMVISLSISTSYTLPIVASLVFISIRNARSSFSSGVYYSTVYQHPIRMRMLSSTTTERRCTVNYREFSRRRRPGRSYRPSNLRRCSYSRRTGSPWRNQDHFTRMTDSSGMTRCFPADYPQEPPVALPPPPSPANK